MDYFHELTQTVNRALDEDIRTGDVTASLIDPEKWAHARIITRQPAVVCGRPWVDEVLRQVDATITPQWHIKDGDQVQAGALLLELTGKARSLLTAERTALNFLQLLSGTATRTNTYVQMIEGTGATLLDTRKTIPGLRRLEKYATHMGGATNHRMGLWDAAMIKDNHVAVAGTVEEAVRRAVDAGVARIIVEVDRIDQIEPALSAGATHLLLDNMAAPVLRGAVTLVGGRVPTEASGGVTLETIRAKAETGVTYISVGRLTQSAPAADIGLDFAYA